MCIISYMLLSQSSLKSISSKFIKEIWSCMDFISHWRRSQWCFDDYGSSYWCRNTRLRRILGRLSSWLRNIIVPIFEEVGFSSWKNRLLKSFMGCLLLFLQKHHSCLYWNLLCWVQWMVWLNLLCWVVANFI